MKKKILLFIVLVSFITTKTQSQILVAAAGKLINSGDILFTNEVNTAEKKKEVASLKSFSLDQSVYGTIYLNKKINNHSAFSESGGVLSTWVYIKSKDGKQVSFKITLKPEDGEKKSYCFEIIPAKPSLDNETHRELAVFFGQFSAGVYPMTFYIGEETGINGKAEVDLTKGIGSFQQLKDEQERLDKIKAEEDAKRAAEAEKKRKEEEAKRAAALKIFQSSKDAVKVAVKNKCQNPGTIYYETGDAYTSTSFTLNGGDQSNYIICRPGNKIYLGNELIHTVAASSNNKVIDFCPPKTDAQIKQEEFEKGMLGISFDVKNSCSQSLYYLVEEGGSTLNTSLNGNTQTGHQFKKKGTKVWLSNDKHQKVSLIFEVTSYSQYGTMVILCK